MNYGTGAGVVAGRRTQRWASRTYVGGPVTEGIGLLPDQVSTVRLMSSSVGSQHLVDVPPHVGAVRVTGASGTNTTAGDTLTRSGSSCWRVVLPVFGQKLVVQFSGLGETQVAVVSPERTMSTLSHARIAIDLRPIRAQGWLYQRTYITEQIQGVTSAMPFMQGLLLHYNQSDQVLSSSPADPQTRIESSADPAPPAIGHANWRTTSGYTGIGSTSQSGPGSGNIYADTGRVLSTPGFVRIEWPE
jgi:hypothetical protein